MGQGQEERGLNSGPKNDSCVAGLAWRSSNAHVIRAGRGEGLLDGSDVIAPLSRAILHKTSLGSSGGPSSIPRNKKPSCTLNAKA